MKYRTRRRMTDFEVALHADGFTRAANIVDITERGARIRLEFGNLVPDTLVSMDVRGQTFEAEVVWNKEGEAGLEFKALLPLDVLAAINRNLRRIPEPKKKRFLIG